jgi:tetratricopeptide (TPR) repeat protein
MKTPTRRVHRFVSSAFLILWCATFRTPLSAQDTYRAPANPPKSHYVIDARFDLSPKGAIEGTETIILKNTGPRPMGVLAVAWSIGPASTISVGASGSVLTPLNPEKKPALSSPLFYPLPKPLAPGKRLKLEVTFRKAIEFSAEDTEFGDTSWFPRLWWDGLPLHDSFSVKLDVPAGFAVAASGRLNAKTGRYENEGARTFGIYLGKGMKTESRESGGVLITTLATEKGARAAAACLDTAADVIRFCQEWLSFYPFPFLSIIPGGSGRWGGYPFATGIVAIHGQETFREGEPLVWWQHITSHEIGHEYWSEWVLDPDDPAWLWIGMGIFIDTEYMMTRNLDPERRAGWMGNYLDGLRRYYDLTVDIPPARVEKIHYDHNNTVIHSKGPSIIFALDSVLGRPEFEKIFKKCLREYGGKRLDWKDFQGFCEKESGQDLAWFFDQWVRSNVYLCYKIEAKDSIKDGDGYLSTIKVSKLGTMRMPIPVKAVFEDGTAAVQSTDRFLDTNILTFRSKAKLKEAVLDPEKKLAMLDEPLTPISPEAAELLALGWEGRDSPAVYKAIKGEDIRDSNIWYWLGLDLFELGQYPESFDCFEKVSGLQREGLEKFAALGWMGLLKDLQGKRPEALRHYQEALRFDTGESMRHDQFNIRMDKKWVEDRLNKPFSLQTSVEIPVKPTAEDLVGIVAGLNWTKEGKTPLLIFEKTSNLAISDVHFWLKMGLLLFDGGYYSQSYKAFDQVFTLDSSALLKFTALVWMGHLLDLQKQRDKAVEYYKKALELDTGETMTHSQYGMQINRQWVEERLKSPFVRKGK